MPRPEFQTVDYDSNSRNNTTFSYADTPEISSMKQNKNSTEVAHVKNRRTGSTDCTNTKLTKQNIKRIPNFHKHAVIELDNHEGEIIVSNRRNDPDRVSPSPSPAKYNIEPTKGKPFDMNCPFPFSNFDSGKYKK